MKTSTFAIVTLLASIAFPPGARADEGQATERNSVPMMITGIGLSTVGVAALGVGTGLVLAGDHQCNANAVAESRDLPVAEGAAVYQVVRDDCRATSGMAFGYAAIVGGAAFTAVGTALTIAGAWKIPVRRVAGVQPDVRVGLGSVTVGVRF